MASCYVCGCSGADQRREVYVGTSNRISYSKRITVGKSNHYGMRTVCPDCAFEIDKQRNINTIIKLSIAIVFVIFLIFAKLS